MVRVAMMTGTTITGIIGVAAAARFWGDVRAQNAFFPMPGEINPSPKFGDS